MLTFEMLQSAWAQNKIVRMQVSKDETLNERNPYAEASWAVNLAAENDPRLDDYCAAVVNAASDLFLNPSDVTDHEIVLQNSAIDGTTYVRVRWENQAQTMDVVHNLLLDMKKAIMETFHPEIEAERQRMIQTELDKPHVVHQAVFDENGKLTLTSDGLSPF